MAELGECSSNTASLLFSLTDLGIDPKFITEDRVTMESEKYICVRETNSIVVIDMTKPMQPIRLPITADSAIMNPDTPILAYKVQAQTDGTTQDQLHIMNATEQYTELIKSCDMGEKVIYWKWITPKLLGLVTQRADYHWTIEGLTGPVKMFHRRDQLATCSDAKITNYLCNPSKKWHGLVGNRKNPEYETLLFVRPFQGGDQWFSFGAHAATFITFNAEENGTPSTLVCSAIGLTRVENKHLIRLSISYALGAQPAGKPFFRKKQVELNTDARELPIALQISQQDGLLYILTKQGLISVHDIETAEPICSCKIGYNKIFLSTESTKSGSFYAVNKRGQVLLTNINNSTIPSFLLGGKLTLPAGETPQWQKLFSQLLATRAKLHDYRQLHLEMLNKMEGLKELQNGKDNIIEEIGDQLTNKMTELDNHEKAQEELQNEIEQLKNENTKLTKERDNIMRNLEEFRSLIESNNVESKFIEFTHDKLREVTNDFSDSHKIGEGGYGPVYKAFLELKPVAIKTLRRDSRFGKKEFDQEVQILSKVRHPNVVMLLGACWESRALVYELMPNGSLYDILRDQQRSNCLTWKTRIRIASNICSALMFLHSYKPHGIVHGDLKSANILLDSNYTGKLSDFGICRHLQKTEMAATPSHITEYPKGTPAYMDREYMETGELTTQYDVYSFGIVLLELVTGKDPKGLRNMVTDALQTGPEYMGPYAAGWPTEEAYRMLLLGVDCSSPSREHRPDLAKEVWPIIESMRCASLRS